MNFSALAISSVFAASSAFAGFIPGATQVLTASDIAGTGSYNQGTSWTVSFTFDGDLAQSSLDGDFGNWTMTVTDMSPDDTGRFDAWSLKLYGH
jgi:hypothetical protein